MRGEKALQNAIDLKRFVKFDCNLRFLAFLTQPGCVFERDSNASFYPHQDQGKCGITI